jgi:branched-chain amino acid aminotransferase
MTAPPRQRQNPAPPEFTPSFQPNPHPRTAEQLDAILADPGFGNHFTDHMFLAKWTPDEGWTHPRVVPYGPLTLDPATAVLHYAQEVFEGLKAYAHDDGSVWLFRPEENAARMQRSSRRLALPELPTDWFVGSIKSLIDADRAWVPYGDEKSLYIRPFMFASERFLGVRPAQHVSYGVIASPAGAYFPGGVKPVSIWLSADYARAGAGGTGAAKCGGNYASSLLPQQEAAEHGCAQVAFLDSAEHRWVEELGGMNLYFVQSDGSIVTPSLTDSILPGITRDSIMSLARDLGHDVVERRVSIDEWRDGCADGTITEVFACGTAAVVTPVRALKWEGGEAVAADGEAGKVTLDIRSALVDIQYGHAEDRHHWMTNVVPA